MIYKISEKIRFTACRSQILLAQYIYFSQRDNKIMTDIPRKESNIWMRKWMSCSRRRTLSGSRK